MTNTDIDFALERGKITVGQALALRERSIEERWGAAVHDLRKSGVKVRHNIQKCCRSCIMPADLGMTDEQERGGKPWAYTYGGQGFAVTWFEGLPYSRGKFRRAMDNGGAWSVRRLDPEEGVLYNHGNGAGVALRDAFEAQGFAVDWDGTDMQCVRVLTGATRS